MPECYDLCELYELGLERKRQKRVKQRKGFKLLCLPVLARNEVIRSMDIHEIIKLSLSSRKMEGMIRNTKVKVISFEIHVNINNSILKIESLKKVYYRCDPDHQKEGSANLGPQILSRLIDKNSSSFQNCVSIFKYLQTIISFESLCLHVDFEGMSRQFFKEILTEPALKDFEFLQLDNGEIDAKCLDLVMETAHNNSTKVPVDYYHENAFKFYDIFYGEAEWVRIEHLFTLKNQNAVALARHNLTLSDLNSYIKVWIDNDHDMVGLVVINMSTFQPEIIFDGINVLLGQRNGFTFYLVATNPTKQRKHQILGVTFYSNIISLFSWGKSQPIPFKGNVYDDSWEPEYKVLRILNKKKELEEELKRIQKLLETDQDQNLVEKKNEISRVLQNVSTELNRYNLVFRDGFYSYM